MKCVIAYQILIDWLIDWLCDLHTCRASRLYHRVKPMVVEFILNMAAKCPELKAKAQLPRCTYNPAYILSLGPRYTSSFSYMMQLQSHYFDSHVMLSFHQSQFPFWYHFKCQLCICYRLRGCNGSRNNKARRLPAHVLARSFMQKRYLVHTGILLWCIMHMYWT